MTCVRGCGRPAATTDGRCRELECVLGGRPCTIVHVLDAPGLSALFDARDEIVRQQERAALALRLEGRCERQPPGREGCGVCWVCTLRAELLGVELALPAEIRGRQQAERRERMSEPAQA